MIKKIIIIAVILTMVLGISAYSAETGTPDTAPQGEPPAQTEPSVQPGQRGQRPQGGGMRGGRGMPTDNSAGENVPPPDRENFDPSQSPESTADGGTYPNQMPGGRGGMGRMPGGIPEDVPQDMQTPDGTTNTQSAQVTTQDAQKSFFDTYSTPIFSVVLLAMAFVFVIFYKRKKF